MSMLVNRFDYPQFDSIDNPATGKRVYACPDGTLLPSVTTILSETKDMTVIDDWKKRTDKYYGTGAAQKQVTEACDVGTLMHDSIERHIRGEDRPIKGNLIHKMAHKMADRIISRGLSRVDEIWGVEIPLYFPHAYAGRTDAVGVFEGEESIMDHKNSRKIKKEEWLDDYKIQLCAYSLAHNEMFNTKIRQGVIFMAARETDDYETFILSGSEFDDFTEKWIKKLEIHLSSQDV